MKHALCFLLVQGSFFGALAPLLATSPVEAEEIEAEQLQFPLPADKIKALKQEAKKVVKTLASNVKITLKAAVAHQGFEYAISVCNLTMPGLAEMAADNGWQVERTSLKWRNPNNRPDKWEREQLLSFEQSHDTGKSIASLDTYTVVSVAGRRQFRYMKAIPVRALCLSCHGTSISSTVSARLHSLYPQDRAIGFLHGDIRGAFTLKKWLDNGSN